MTKLPPTTTPLQRESFEERAAIKEYSGNLPREQSEREAFYEVFYPPKKKSQ